MSKKKIIDNSYLEIITLRLCQQLIETYGDFDDTAILGLQPRGVHFASYLISKLKKLTGKEITYGKLDITFFRDDFGRREEPLIASTTDVPFLIENKKVIVIDDVLFTGRSVRAALDAMTAYGRPQSVELLVLIDRRYTRDLPIQANYVGKTIDSSMNQDVKVEWLSDGAEEDVVWLNTIDNE